MDAIADAAVPPVTAAAAKLDTMVPRRYALIDLQSLDYDRLDGDLEAKVRSWVDQTSASTDPRALALLWKAILGEAAISHAWAPWSIGVRSMPQARSPYEPVRRATRVIAMVHELHKIGYQRIRISPGISPSGSHWRCAITYADNVEPDGFTILHHGSEDGLVAYYSSADENRYFGWADAAGLSARALAFRFLERFPHIAKNGVGRDWLYAGWLLDVLGRAEQGGFDDILVLYADYLEINDAWLPPPPDGGTRCPPSSS